MDIRIKFGLRVREMRLQKNVSQEDLAHSAEIDRTYLQSIEKGKRNVSISTIEKISKALNVSMETLIKNF